MLKKLRDILKSKPSKFITTEDALKDIEPFFTDEELEQIKKETTNLKQMHDFENQNIK